MYEVFRIPGFGKLMLEHVFYELGYDLILFVCKDMSGKRFLCACYQLGQNWIVGQVGEKILIDLIDDQITIREVFEQHCDPKWNVSWDGEVYSYSTIVPDDVLPRKGALLEIDPQETRKYRETLLQPLQADS